MEELLVYALLLYEEILTEDSYNNRLNELFIENPDNETLLYLEWENDLNIAISYIRTNFDYNSINHELFGKILMDKISDYYYKCANIKEFGNKMYSLWESLPGNIQDKQPFQILSYADDPLSWGDEEQSKKLYEDMLNHYKD